MLVAIDIGYSHAKALSVDGRRVMFPSVVGEVQQMEMNLSGKDGYIQLNTNEGEWFIGDAALDQSVYQTRRQDREWTYAPEYRALFMAVVSELTTASNATIDVITGLPVAYFADHQKLIESLKGLHTIKRGGRRNQKIQINEMICLPQGLASVLSEALDDKGNVKPGPVSQGTVGLLDIGGHTVNVATFSEMRAISKQTISINAGMWGALSEIEKRINAAYPGQDLHGHEVIKVMKSGKIKHFGNERDVTGIVSDVLQPFTRRILAEASQVWGSAAKLDALLVSGGGAEAIGPAIAEQYPHARIVEAPQWANALGYLKFGRRQFKV